jgi:TetR/AcrR family transcriptional regulator, transcriptional repressor for nem operon
MARPREFNEAVVLAAAIYCFWTRGYEATSVRDLADNMGITGASLYTVFGDKRSLYRRALNTCIDQRFSKRVNGRPPRWASRTTNCRRVRRAVQASRSVGTCRA